MKRNSIIIIGGLIILVGVVAALLVHKQQSIKTNQSSPSKSSAQVLPVSTNPIQNTSSEPGIAITNVQVENNTDPATGNPVNDRLQFAIQNSSSKTAQNLEVYYTLTDAKAKQSESYYQKLTGLSIAPGQSTNVYLDNGAGAGHYPENKYSIYHTSTNPLSITFEVSAQGFKPVTTQVQKGAGSGDNKD
jgi:hypothetical protein